MMVTYTKENVCVGFDNKLKEGLVKLFYYTLKQMRKRKANILTNAKLGKVKVLTNEEEIREKQRECFKEMLEECD